MNGPFDKGIDGQDLGLFLAISEEMAQEEQERLLEEQEQDEPDDLDEEEDEGEGQDDSIDR